MSVEVIVNVVMGGHEMSWNEIEYDVGAHEYLSFVYM